MQDLNLLPASEVVSLLLQSEHKAELLDAMPNAGLTMFEDGEFPYIRRRYELNARGRNMLESIVEEVMDERLPDSDNQIIDIINLVEGELNSRIIEEQLISYLNYQ